jgi:hypothetical protein
VATQKPVVKYRTDRVRYISVGAPALIVPFAHPSEHVTGDGDVPVRTSMVLWAYADGSFETENTCYVPA